MTGRPLTYTAAIDRAGPDGTGRDLTRLIKEGRALLPMWAACAAAITAGIIFPDRGILQLSALAYGFGSIAIGAQSVGQEYSGRTLPMLLSQPLSRRRLLLTKMAATLVLLVTLNALVWWSPLGGRLHMPWVAFGGVGLLLPFACGLLVAPWLTMLCRSQLAGIVFTAAVPGVFLVLSQIVAGRRHGFGTAAAHRLALDLWSPAMIAVVALAAVAGWRTFMRLEAVDGRGRELHLPEWVRGIERVRPAHPIWMLVKKEVRLQQLTFVVALLYIAASILLSLMPRFVEGPDEVPLAALATLYFGLIPLLVGSLASAEERQLGTNGWQSLLPVASRTQWAVKAGVVFALAILLGICLPLALGTLLGSGSFLDFKSGSHLFRGNAFEYVQRWFRTLLPIVLGLAALALYLSSLCRSGISALMLSLPVGAAALAAVRLVDSMAWTVGRRFGRPLALGHMPLQFTNLLPLAVAAAFVVLLLLFASRNHRSGERGIGRVAAQAISIVAFAVMAQVLLSIV